MITLNEAHLKAALDHLDRLRQKSQPQYEYFVINIDDALVIFRQIRRDGFRLFRERKVNGKGGLRFMVHDHAGFKVATLLVDVWRYVPRGKILGITKAALELPPYQPYIIPQPGLRPERFRK